MNPVQTRRGFLQAAASTTALTAVSGCKWVEQHFTPQAIPEVVQKASNLILNVAPSFESLIAQFGNLIPANVMVNISNWEANVKTFAGQLATAPTVQAGESAITAVIGFASNICDAIEQLPELAAMKIAGITVSTIVGAVKVSLLFAAALFPPATTPPPAARRMAATAPSAAAMPLPIAQQILASVAATRR